MASLKLRSRAHWLRSPYIDYITEGSAGDAQSGVEETESDANQPTDGGAEESALDLGTRLLRVTPGQPLMLMRRLPRLSGHPKTR